MTAKRRPRHDEVITLRRLNFISNRLSPVDDILVRYSAVEACGLSPPDMASQALALDAASAH